MSFEIESWRFCHTKNLKLFQFSNGLIVCLDVNTGKGEYCDCGIARCGHIQAAKKYDRNLVSTEQSANKNITIKRQRE